MKLKEKDQEKTKRGHDSPTDIIDSEDSDEDVSISKEVRVEAK